MAPVFAVPKPGKRPKTGLPYKEFRDGRQVCFKTKAGREEYNRRKRVAWEKQKGRCSLCGLELAWDDATADHKITRGMGGSKHDDRQENITAAHLYCNAARGSKPFVPCIPM